MKIQQNSMKKYENKNILRTFLGLNQKGKGHSKA